MAYPPSATPRRWSNQDVTLYHATLDQHARSIEKTGVDLAYAKPARDFGQGFYTTTLQRQAEAWAWQLAAQTPGGPGPAVIAFTVSRDDLASLDALWFVRGAYDAEDFWSFVFHCRGGSSATHGRPGSSGWYDVVVGPVAALWRQRVVLQDYDQVSFHTDRGVRLLDASSKVWWSV